MMDFFKKCDVKKCQDAALLILRIAMAIVFIQHGYAKLFTSMPGMTGFTMMVAKIGFPMPAFFAYIAALAEFVGGIGLLLGVCTRFFAFFLSINMFVVLVAMKHFKFPSSDLEFMLFAVAIVLCLTDAGAYSLSEKFMKKKST